ncbi:hypothetical protein M0805_006471 [Coniferiporia weirii]|nr:hypothetical protein M0805_006471 [Coniferiporia weirii]
MSSAEALPSLNNTFGCLFLAGILWGSGSVQLYFYYDKYTKIDKWGLKTYIFILYALDTLHQALFLKALYLYFVTDFANIADLDRLERPLIDVTLLAALVDGLSQCLYVMRIWHLSNRNFILTGVLAAFVLGQFAATTVYFAQVYHLPEISELTTVIRTERAMNSIVAITDIAIATVIVFLLRSLRSGVKQTDSLISRLVLYTVSSGLITSIVALEALITAVVLPKTFIYLISDLVIPKLYFNSIMAMLNSRQKLRNRDCDDSKNGISLSDIRARPAGSVSVENVRDSLSFPHKFDLTSASLFAL